MASACSAALSASNDAASARSLAAIERSFSTSDDTGGDDDDVSVVDTVEDEPSSVSPSVADMYRDVMGETWLVVKAGIVEMCPDDLAVERFRTDGATEKASTVVAVVASSKRAADDN